MARAGAAISPDQAQDALAYLTTEKRKFWNQFADDAAIEDGIITVNEAKRLLKETLALQQVLIDMKLHLEEGTT